MGGEKDIKVRVEGERGETWKDLVAGVAGGRLAVTFCPAVPHLSPS